MVLKINIKSYIILFLIILIIYIFSYNIFSYREGFTKKVGKAFKKAGKQIKKGVDKAAEETRKAAEKAAEETRKAAERAKREAEQQAKRVAEEARKAAERAAAELERLNFIKAFEKLFGAFGSLEKIFNKFPRQITSLFQDATNFKKDTIRGIQNI